MASSTQTAQQLPSLTLIWKHDTSAGEIPAHVYYPTSSSTNSPHPIALIFHAGGFCLGTTNLIPKPEIGNLVARGFVVVTPEYRLCPQISLYDGPIQDAKDVFKWCQDKLPALLREQQGVEADASRIVTMGHSAGGLLALTTGLCSNPPVAIVDFYGVKYLSDASWRRSLPAFAQIPDQPEDVISKVYEGPQATTSLPMFIDGKPNLSDTRCAWYIQQLKNGTSVSKLVPDGDYERVDATSHFTKDFPPTYFSHGVPDIFVDHKLTVRAYEELKKLGVKTEIMIADDVGHVFDIQIDEKDPLFGKYVLPALNFLEKHV